MLDYFESLASRGEGFNFIKLIQCKLSLNKQFISNISKLKNSIAILLLFSVSFLHAQTIIKSQIISAKGQEAIGFVHIFNKNTRLNSLSDSDGWFNIQCKSTDTIVVSCLGFKSLFLPAADIIQKNSIELAEDTITLDEVTVSPVSAYNMLLQARDSTNKYQMKSFHGTCLRQDNLLFKGNVERQSEADIIFYQKGIKREFADVNYWLEDFNSESLGKQSAQPRLAYPNTIPLNPIKIPKEKAKYTIVLNSDSLLIINVQMSKPNKDWINECNYFINKRIWIFMGIEYKGDYRMKPLRKGNYYFFQINDKLTFDTIGDSCVIKNYYDKFVFSHKRIDPKNLWEYFVNMDIIPSKKVISMPEDKKLRRLDILLYKTKDKKSNLK